MLNKEVIKKRESVLNRLIEEQITIGTSSKFFLESLQAGEKLLNWLEQEKKKYVSDQKKRIISGGNIWNALRKRFIMLSSKYTKMLFLKQCMHLQCVYWQRKVHYWRVAEVMQ